MSRYGGGGGTSAVGASSAGRAAYGAMANGTSQAGPARQQQQGGKQADDVEASRRMAKTHYDQFNQWVHAGKGRATESAGTRNTAREKLTRLTRQQFQELSTDVYDELCRRIERGEQNGAQGSGGVPFLLSRDDFHPKRNQARQKLATLPLNRFRDLSSDVFFELERRYPEFSRSGSATPSNERRTSDAEVISSPHLRGAAPPVPKISSPARNPGPGGSAAPGVTANEVVIPDKSTMVVEDDYATAARRPPRMSSASGANGIVTTGGARSITPSAGLGNGMDDDKSQAGRSEYFDKMSLGRISDGSGINAGGAKLMHGFTSPSGGVSGAPSTFSEIGGGGGREDVAKVRSEYEARVASLTQKVSTLERELEGAKRNEGRLRELEQTLAERKAQNDKERQQAQVDKEQLQEQHADELRSVRKELDGERSARTRVEVGQRDERSRWEDKVASAHRERDAALATRNVGPGAPGSVGSAGGSSATVAKLQNEVTGLLSELRSFQHRQDELLAERERDLEVIRGLERELAMSKKRDLARPDVGNVNLARSISRPSDADVSATTEDGTIADIHYTTFASSIDDLVHAAHSSSSGDVIPAVRAVVESASRIDDDLSQLDAARRASFFGASSTAAEADQLDALRERAHATLANLVATTQRHATGFGLSPASLVDAAASHVAATIVDIVRIAGMRKASPQEVEAAVASTTTLTSATSLAASPSIPMGLAGSSSQPQLVNAALKSGPPGGAPPSVFGDATGFLGDGPLRPGHESLALNGDGDSAYEDEGYVSSTGDRVLSPHLAPPTQRGGFGGGYADDDDSIRYGTPQPPQPLALKGDDDPMRGPSAAGFASSGSASRAGHEALGSGSQSGSSAPADQIFDSPPTKAGFRMTDNNYGLGPTASEADERENLRQYLEAQTEAIVSSIQSLLSSIRTGSTQGGPPLGDTLTQIITIVSSIVAFTDDALPAHPESDKILRELADNCDRLSELQGIAGAGSNAFDKPSKQAMAAASFGVAKALKELNAFIALNEESML